MSTAHYPRRPCRRPGHCDGGRLQRAAAANLHTRRACGRPSIARCCRSPSPTIRCDTELDARNAKPPARFEVKAPERAPNVIVFLIDDIGFGHPATFGGQIPMPTLDRLAAQGLKYNRFHTTALCSPTRVALLTGRNHHTNNAGAIMEVATAFPGNTGARPASVTPLAEILRQNGYSTGAFGKYHETAPWEVSVSGPFDRWPTRSGFDKFYGFIGGETNQWAPLIFDGTVKIEPPHDPNYHFTTDMTNQAIQWIRSQQALTPDKPFFTYFATGATHAPHHVPKEWIDKFRGKFDARLGQVPRGDLRPAEEAGASSRRTPSSQPGLPTSRPGTRSAPTRSGCSPGRWKCTPPSPRTPTTRSAAS